MDTNIVHEASFSVDGADGDQEVETDKGSLLEGFMGEVTGHLRRDGELLKKVELDIACSSQKVLKLNLLMMNVGMRESEYESLTSDKEALADSFEKSLEFDLLSKILYSEARELQKFIAGLQTKTVKSRKLISSCKHSVEAFSSMEEKLLDSEESLKQLQEQVLDIRRQSATFRRTLTCFDGEENGNGDEESEADFLEEEHLLNMDTRINTETTELQRGIFMMFEKSLAREMNLENKLNESRQVEEEMKQKLFSYENKLFCMEEETSNVSEKLFEVDNVAEVLMGISKELLGRLHILQFNLNGSLKREDELRSKFDSAEKHLKSQERTLKMHESGETRLKDFQVSQTDSLKASLRETEKNLNIVSSEAFTLREKVSSLEKQLQESEIQLQHAVASAEASLEKQNMLYSTIGDMENLIEDLKLKVSKADSRADSTEDKCIILSETNADLNEELNFLRGRMEHLELALHQSEGTKLATAKDIGIRTKVITNLVMQLAIERERLQKQISTLAKENKTLTAKLQQTDKNSSAYMRQDNQEHGKESVFGKHDRTTCTRESEGEVIGVLTTSFELDQTEENISELETETKPRDSSSEIDTVRRIDAGVLNIKHVFIAILVLLISAAVYSFQQPSYPF